MVIATDVAAQRLPEVTGARCPLKTSRLREMACDCVIPAFRAANGRYRIRRADLPAIARILGMQATELKTA